MKLQSYLNDPQLKTDFLAQVEKHRKADMIEQGTYGHGDKKWKGCAVACSLRSLAIMQGEPLKTKVVDAIREVLAVHENAIATGEWDGSAADSAYSAYSAAYQKHSKELLKLLKQTSV